MESSSSSSVPTLKLQTPEPPQTSGVIVDPDTWLGNTPVLAVPKNSIHVYFKNGKAYARHDLPRHTTLWCEGVTLIVKNTDVVVDFKDFDTDDAEVLMLMMQFISSMNAAAKQFASKFPATVPKSAMTPFSEMKPIVTKFLMTNVVPQCVSMTEKRMYSLLAEATRYEEHCRESGLVADDKKTNALMREARLMEELSNAFPTEIRWWLKGDRLDNLFYAMTSHAYAPRYMLNGKDQGVRCLWVDCSRFAHRCAAEANCTVYYDRFATSAFGVKPHLLMMLSRAVKKDEELTWCRFPTHFGVVAEHKLREVVVHRGPRCECSACEAFRAAENKKNRHRGPAKSSTKKRGGSGGKKKNKKSSHRGAAQHQHHHRGSGGVAVKKIAADDKMVIAADDEMTKERARMAKWITLAAPKTASEPRLGSSSSWRLISVSPFPKLECVDLSLEVPSTYEQDLCGVHDLASVIELLPEEIVHPTSQQVKWAYKLAELALPYLMVHIGVSWKARNFMQVMEMCEYARKFHSVFVGMLEATLLHQSHIDFMKFLCDNFIMAQTHTMTSHIASGWWAAVHHRLTYRFSGDIHFRLSGCYRGMLTQVGKLHMHHVAVETRAALEAEAGIAPDTTTTSSDNLMRTLSDMIYAEHVNDQICAYFIRMVTLLHEEVGETSANRILIKELSGAVVGLDGSTLMNGVPLFKCLSDSLRSFFVRNSMGPRCAECKGYGADMALQSRECGRFWCRGCAPDGSIAMPWWHSTLSLSLFDYAKRDNNTGTSPAQQIRDFCDDSLPAFYPTLCDLSVLRIQAHVRMFIVRRRWLRARVRLEKTENTSHALTLVQPFVAARVARMRWLKLRNVAVRLQRVARRTLEMAPVRRAFLARRAAALHVQRVFRAQCLAAEAREQLAVLRAEHLALLRAEKLRATLTLQSCIRGALERARYQRKLAAVCRVQAIVKARVARRRGQALQALQAVRARERAVITLQCAMRGVLARRLRVKRMTALRVLQSAARGKLARMFVEVAKAHKLLEECIDEEREPVFIPEQLEEPEKAQTEFEDAPTELEEEAPTPPPIHFQQQHPEKAQKLEEKASIEPEKTPSPPPVHFQHQHLIVQEEQQRLMMMSEELLALDRELYAVSQYHMQLQARKHELLLAHQYQQDSVVLQQEIYSELCGMRDAQPSSLEAAPSSLEAAPSAIVAPSPVKAPLPVPPVRRRDTRRSTKRTFFQASDFPALGQHRQLCPDASLKKTKGFGVKKVQVNKVK